MKERMAIFSLALLAVGCTSTITQQQLSTIVTTRAAHSEIGVHYQGRKKGYDYFRAPYSRIGYWDYRIPDSNTVVRQIMPYTPDGRKWILCGPHAGDGNWFKDVAEQ